MTVTSKTGGHGTSVIKKDYPVEEGLELGTTKIEGREITLEPEETSIVPERMKEGL